MNIKIDKNVLLKGLQEVEKVVSSKPRLPILANVKISATSEGVKLETTNVDTIIVKLIPIEIDNVQCVQIESTGSVLLNCKNLLNLVKNMNGNTVSVCKSEGTDGICIVKCGKTEHRLNLSNVSHYPDIKIFKHNDPIQIEKQLLKTIIRQTVFSASKSENRPVLTGVNFHYEANELKCVATDSYRLSKKVVPLISSHESFDVTVPSKALKILDKLLNKKNGTVAISTDRESMIFEFENTIIKSRLLEGIYPETREFIPNSFGIEIQCNQKELLNALKSIEYITKTSVSNVVKLNILPDEKKLLLTAKSPEIGEVEEEIQIDMISGGNLRIACSALFLVDALKSIGNTDVIIGFNGDMRPFVLRDKHDEVTTQLIVPVRMV